MATERLEFLGYTLDIIAPVFSTGPNFNVPVLRLYNHSSSASITGFDMTIGDTTFNFDEAVNDFPSVMTLVPTLNSPDRIGSGEIRSDNINYSFTGFNPGEFFQFATDIDIDSINSNEDFREVLFDLNGSDSGDNAVITVDFSDGSTISGQLPDFSQTIGDIYTFSQSTEAILGYEIEFSTPDFNQPWIQIRNTSSSERIVEFSLSIGDTDFNFDAVAGVANQSPGVVETLLKPDLDFEGGVRSDELAYEFSGFGPAKTFQAIDVDFDVDSRDSFEDYRQILFDLNGLEDSDNAVATVTFSNGVTLSGRLPDFAETPDNVYTFSQVLDARHITVDTLVDENNGNLSPGDVSLREAILLANSSDTPSTITFAEDLNGGKILLTLGELDLTHSITIDGDLDHDNRPDITLDANHASGVLLVSGSAVNLNGLVLTGGKTQSGGAIHTQGGTLVVSNSVLTGNIAEDEGGAIFLNNIGNVSLQNSSIENNTAGRNGGGIATVYGELSLHNSVISGNTAGLNGPIGYGGGIYTEGGSIEVVNSSVSSNASDRGGGISGEFYAELALKNSTVSNNIAEQGNGGGIYASSHSTLRIMNSAISGNAVTKPRNPGEIFGGGGIAGKNSAIALTGSTVSNNTSSDEGGGLFIHDGTLTVDNSTISNNAAPDDNGGGIRNFRGTVDISNTTISHNLSGFGGGGIGNDNLATVTNSHIFGNTSTGPGRAGGGGISNTGALTLIESRVAENIAARNGGGILTDDGGVLSVVRSTISENRSKASGAGIAVGVKGGSISVRDSTISGNRAQDSGGGIYVQSESTTDLTLTHSTITLNVADTDRNGQGTGGGVSGSGHVQNTLIAGNVDTANDHPDVSGAFSSGGHNLIGNGNGGSGFTDGNQSDQVGSATNPIDPLLGPLADNGGLTPTHALLSGSPAVDAANPVDFSETDQRGVTRPQGTAPDIGSFELMSPGSKSLFFSLTKGMTLQGSFINNEDIVHFDGTEVTLWFDGSDLGLNSVIVDAFDVMDDETILMSFNTPIHLAGVGQVDDSDIVKFTPTSLGEVTAGEFSLYFDGSDVGLTQSGEDIDALTGMPNGELIISTNSSFKVPGVSGRDEDLIRFTPTSLGETTRGTWAMYFDGSDVSLAAKPENIDGVSIDASGQVLLTTSGHFRVPGLTGADEDGFIFNPTSLGARTTGNYTPQLFFDGDSIGLGANDIVAVDFGNRSVEATSLQT